jgi:hypothetical protein
MSRLAKFGTFWWEFIVGEDWRASAQIGLAIAATAAIAASGISAWWVLPPAVILVLYASLRRAIRD